MRNYIVLCLLTLAHTHPISQPMLNHIKRATNLWTPIPLNENPLAHLTEDQLYLKLNTFNPLSAIPHSGLSMIQVKGKATPDSFDARS